MLLYVKMWQSISYKSKQLTKISNYVNIWKAFLSTVALVCSEKFPTQKSQFQESFFFFFQLKIDIFLIFL